MKKYILAFLILLVSSPVFSANHYVRAGASGNGSDWTNACSGFSGSCAPSLLTRGDTYYVADGAYTGGLSFNTTAAGTSVITIKKATVGDHGTATGWSDVYGDGQAVFDESIAFYTGYWVFDGVTGGGPGNWDGSVTPYGFRINKTSGGNNWSIGITGNTNTIRHLEIVGSGVNGFDFGIEGHTSSGTLTCSYIWMRNIGSCPFFGAANYPATTYYEYIYLESMVGGASHTEIMNQSEPGSPGNTHIRYSLFTDWKSTGGLMWDNRNSPAASLYVYGNVFYQNKGDSIAGNGLIGGWGSAGVPLDSAYVYNNTFINADSAPLGNVTIGTATNTHAYNNLFYSTLSPSFEDWQDHNYNYFINSGGSHSEANEQVSASGDPFVNYTGFDFRLSSNTTAGNVLSSPYNVDMYGNSRSTWTRGAVEYNGVPADDSTPDQFTFTDITGATISTQYTSNAITVTGITTTTTTISISGNSGTYSVNGGAYTSSAGDVYLNDVVTVRQTSSPSYLTAVNTTLNIGGVTDTYSVTTAAQLSTPPPPSILIEIHRP